MTPAILSRRELLHTLAVCNIATIAGCIERQDPSTSTDEPESDTSRPSSSTQPSETGEDESKRVQWSTDIGIETRSDLLLHQGYVFAAGSNSVRAIELDSRTPTWRSDTEMAISETMALGDGRLYVSESHQLGAPPAKLYAIDISNGETTWKRRIGRIKGTAPVFDSGTVYVGGNGVHAFDALSGDLRWEYRPDKDVSFGAPPAILDGTVFIGTEDDGTMYSLDTETGELNWARKIDEDIISRPAVTTDTVYVGTVRGNLFAVDRTTGEIKWTTTIGGHITNGPTVSQGNIFVCSENNIYSIDPNDGSIDWEVSTGNRIDAPPVADDDTIFITSLDGNLYALAASNGDERWKFSTGNNIRGAAAVSDETVYISDNTGVLYALRRGRRGR